jgi:hypothetical protein
MLKVVFSTLYTVHQLMNSLITIQVEIRKHIKYNQSVCFCSAQHIRQKGPKICIHAIIYVLLKLTVTTRKTAYFGMKCHEVWYKFKANLILYIFCATRLHMYYLIPTFCTMFLFINYCSDTFWPQFLAIFRELVVF